MFARYFLPVTLSTLLAIQGCASPGLSSDADEAALSQQHWLGDTRQLTGGPLSYVSPQDPFTSYEIAPVNWQAGTPRSELASTAEASQLSVPMLSPGDRLRVDLPPKSFFEGVLKTSDDTFTGIYEVGFDGTLKLPYTESILVAGKPLKSVESIINQALEQAGYFKPGMARLNVTMQQWAPIQVSVSGAVFSPGTHYINPRLPEASADQMSLRGGSAPQARFLTRALMAAGGVRPDADLRIELIRGKDIHRVDLNGAIAGYQTADLPLVHGDHIRVNSRGLPDQRIIRPTAITVPGIRVFISNLTVPSQSNAASALGKHATSLPYGSQLHTAVVSGNCAGGAVSTNSNRYAVLVTSDPITHRPITVERRVEQVLSMPGDASVNPYLMPNDSVVCYDSRISNVRDIGRTISDILSPITRILR
ncbi:polysaccharide export protein [Marinobacter daepoensis]|uniref:polysaccharide biosynthesis/export family protein n=1 Tax=Marinobacter daepoensis TaxID=262077 RepID=UPI001C946412|nr:polysaccharide export protein [Marinobacter daepoensis]MBY6032309.1 polysaccharide export protein [Marinobacter daepoensis]